MKKNAFWMLLANGSYSLCQLLCMMVISKYLGVTELGIFSLGLAISAPIMLFSNFGLRIIWITEAAKNIKIKTFKVLRILTSITGLIVCFGFIYIYIEDTNQKYVIMLIAISKAIENNADIYYAELHKQQNQKKLFISMLSRGALGVIGLFIGTIYYQSLLVATSFYLFGWLISHIVTELSTRADGLKKEKTDISLGSIKKLLTLGLPLAIGLFLVNLNANIPRIILEKNDGLEAIGVFSALYFFIQSGTIIVNSIGQVALPKLSKLYKENKYNEHRKLTIYILFLILTFSLSGALVSYTIGDLLLDLVYGKVLSSYSNILVIFFFLSPFQYSVSIMNQVIASTKENKKFMWNQMLTLIIITVLSLFLVKEFSIEGAFYASSLASLISMIILLTMYNKLLMERKKKNDISK